jgi:hypothetical protein
MNAKAGSRLRTAVSVLLCLAGMVLVATPARGNPDDHAWRAARPVRQEPLESGLWGVFRLPLVLLIYSESHWYSTMDSLGHAGDLISTPGPDAPAGVNWNRESVVIVAVGEFPYLHCSVRIREVRRIGYRALCDVSVEVQSALILSPTSPYFITRIDKRGEVRSVAARYEYIEPYASMDVVRVWYSNRAAFLAGDGDSTPGVSWSAVKSLYR